MTFRRPSGPYPLLKNADECLHLETSISFEALRPRKLSHLRDGGRPSMGFLSSRVSVLFVFVLKMTATRAKRERTHPHS